MIVTAYHHVCNGYHHSSNGTIHNLLEIFEMILILENCVMEGSVGYGRSKIKNRN